MTGTITFLSFILVLIPSIICQIPYEPQACENPRIRREFRELSHTDRGKYILANVCMREVPSHLPDHVGSPSLYDDFVYIHMRALEEAHGVAAFMPWHRSFIGMYEYALGKYCGFHQGLPYWDWSHDSQAPERSELWSHDYFGGPTPDGSSFIGYSNFSHMWAAFPEPHPIDRNWVAGRGGTIVAAQFSPVEMEWIVDLDTYDEFRKMLEGLPHNQVHASIGGDELGDFGQPTKSVNDPIFWLHHCNIDRWYARWQKEHPEAARTYAGNTIPRVETFDAKSSDRMSFYGLWNDLAVKDVFSTHGGMNGLLCYKYSNSIKPIEITNPELLDVVTEPSVQAFHARMKDVHINPMSFRPDRLSGIQQAEIHEWQEWSGRGFHGYPQDGSRHCPNSVGSEVLGESIFFKEQDEEWHGSPNNPFTPHPYDRQDHYNLRHHEPVPDWLLRALNYDEKHVAFVREKEGFFNELVDYVNSVEGYVSTCSLSQVLPGRYKSMDDNEYSTVTTMRKTLLKAAKNAILARTEDPLPEQME